MLVKREHQGRLRLISGPAAPAAVKSANVTCFMVNLYWGAAEPMATGCLWSMFRLFVFCFRCPPQDGIKGEPCQRRRGVASAAPREAVRLQPGGALCPAFLQPRSCFASIEGAPSRELVERLPSLCLMVQGSGHHSSLALHILFCS